MKNIRKKLLLMAGIMAMGVCLLKTGEGYASAAEKLPLKKAQIIVKSEITRLQITNLIDTSYFALATTFPAGTVILIDSLSSPKKVTNLTTGKNLLKYMSNNSSWLKLLTGQNRFSYEVDTSPDDVEVTFLLNDRYLGV